FQSMAEVMAGLEGCKSGLEGIVASPGQKATGRRPTHARGESDTLAVGPDAAPRRSASKRWLPFAVAVFFLAGIAVVALMFGGSGSPDTKPVAKATDIAKPALQSPTQPLKVPNPDDAWIKTVQTMPPEEQVKAVLAKLKERNPQADPRSFHNKI